MNRPLTDRYYAIRHVRRGDLLGRTGDERYVRPVRYGTWARLMRRLRLTPGLRAVGYATEDAAPGEVVRVQRAELAARPFAVAR